MRTGKGKHYTPRQIKAYRMVVAAARDLGEPTIEGVFGIKLTFFPPRQGRFDLDNRVKVLMDSLQHAGYFANDGDCVRMEINRGPVLPPSGAVEFLLF